MTNVSDDSLTSAAFRVNDLPLDLKLSLAEFFTSAEAARVVTVSSDFHDIFARSVWHTINYKAIELAEPTRSDAYTRYGRHVRHIDFSDQMPSSQIQCDWLASFPNTTRFDFRIDGIMDEAQNQSIFDAISGFHGLHSVTAMYCTNEQPFDLDALADRLVARSQDATKQPVRSFQLTLVDGHILDQWAVLSKFAQTLEVLKLAKFKISVPFMTDTVPTLAEFATLRPYLAKLPSYMFFHGTGLSKCCATSNRNLFGSSEDSGEEVLFPHLANIDFSVCCASPSLYDYSDIGVERFKSLNSIGIRSSSCPRRADAEERVRVINKIVVQEWPRLERLALQCEFGMETLNGMIKHHPHLTSIDLHIGQRLADENGKFMMGRLLRSFPQLNRITLQCLRGDNVTIDMETGDDDLAQASPVRTMELNSFELTPQVLKLVPMLPKLRFQRIFYCSVSDQVAAIELLQQMKEQNCGGTYSCAVEDVMLFGGQAGWSWAEELVVAFMEALRLLKMIELLNYSNDTVKRISDQFPNVKVRGGTW